MFKKITTVINLGLVALIVYQVNQSMDVYNYGYRNAERAKYDKAVETKMIERALEGGVFSNDSIHLWARDVAIKYDQTHEKSGGGAYDICDGLAYKIETTGVAFDNTGKSYKWHGDKIVPQGLGDEFWDGGEGYNIANACAVILNGAEW